jgi:hypothetical protein
MSDQTLMINELPEGGEAALVNANAPSFFAADFMDGQNLSWRSVKVSYETLALALAQYGAVADAMLEITGLYKLKGYYSSVDPQTAEHIALRVGDLWWAGAGSDMPVIFPASGLQQWGGQQWQPSPDYSADSWDLWANLNDDAGYYWFGSHWNQSDTVADGVTLENSGGQIRIKDFGVGWNKLAVEIKSAIEGALQKSGGAMSGALHIQEATDGDTPYQKQEIDDQHFAHQFEGVPVSPARAIGGSEANGKIVFQKNWANLDRVVLNIARNFYIPGNAGANSYSIDVYDENNVLITGLGQYEFTDENDLFIEISRSIGAGQIGAALELRVGSASAALGAQTPDDEAQCLVYESRLLDLTDESERAQAKEGALEQTLNAHKGDADNPHGVTKAQIGLGSVDDTADEDKPVSTVQAQALSDHNTSSEAHADIRSAIPSEAGIEAIADAAVVAHNTDGASHADIREQVNGLATQQGNWLGQNFPTAADLEAFDQNRPAGFETIPDKTWARVYDDENYDDALTVYAWFGNTLAYQYTMVIDPRNFSTDPIQTDEIAGAAVTAAKMADEAVETAKIKDAAVTFAKMAVVPFQPIEADTTDFGGTIFGGFGDVFISIVKKIKGLFSLMDTTVKKTGNEAIAGIKTFSSAPVIPAANTLPATPSSTRPATENQVFDMAVRKTASVNASVWGSGTVYDEQGREWYVNSYNPLYVRGSVLSNGRSSAGSRIELDLNRQFDLSCNENLPAGAEVVFLSNPLNQLWNANSVLGGGSVGTDWIADSFAANQSAAGYVWAFPAPALLEESGKQLVSTKISSNITAALAYSGGGGTPGQLYAFGGLRVLVALEYPVIFFSGHMRIGFTRA